MARCRSRDWLWLRHDRCLYPGLSSIWTAHGIDAVTRIAHHRDAWQVANWMFAVGIAFTVAGVAVLTSLLVRVSAVATLATVALVLGTAGSTLWLANLAYRLTVTLRTADGISHGEPVPDWYADITAWADDGLLSAAGLLFGASVVAYGIAVAVAEVAPRWTGWFAGIVGLFLIGQFALTGDVVPALIYLAPLPIGVSGLLRAWRR